MGNKITEISVLYVLKESNCNGEGEFNDNFWLRECLAKGNDKQAEKYIGWMEKKYIEDKDEFTSRETLFNTAAMLNLNKRGGYGGTNYAQLKHYVNKYHDFIKREIEIINPDIIICGGTYGLITQYDIIKETEFKKIFDHPHPASRKKR